MIELENISFWFDFKNDNTGLKQIDEPDGFDAVDFKIKQDNGRMGRDIFFAGSNEAKYTFTNTKSEHGFEFDRLIEYDNIYGSESQVGFYLKDDVSGEYFIVGDCDFKKKQTDQFSFFSCNVIVSTDQALVKRRFDTKVDLFSDEDLDGNYIEPVQTSNILIPAKPIIQVSKWAFRPVDFTQTNFGFQSNAAFPLFTQFNGQQEILDSLIPFDTSFFNQTAIEPGSLENQRDLGKIIRAEDDLTNITVSITGLTFQSNGTSVGSVQKTLTVNYGTGFGSGEFDTIFLENSTEDFFNITDQDYEVNIPSLQSGGYLWIRYSMFDPHPSGGVTPIGSFGFNLTGGELSIRLTSTSVDTVSKGVRWEDVIKQVSKSINPNFEFTIPRFEEGGEHYDQFVLDGNLIRGREYPFVVTFKETAEHLNTEVNCDYEVNENSMYVGNDYDFYPNIEIGAFEAVRPDNTYDVGNNNKYLINEFKYKYKKYNQDKDDDNTIDAVHTETETLNANRNSETTKQVDCPWTRDPFLIATTQKKASSETSTSLVQDDQKFILDCIRISPTARRNLTRFIQHYIDGDGRLQLLGSGFNWTILGFQIGDIMTIITDENSGGYTVYEIESNIVTLTPLVGTPSFNGEAFTTVNYPLTNVGYMLRTDEGFDLIDGVESPDNYGNLKYSIKRNILNYWSRYLATSTYWKQEDIRVTYHKNNVDLDTQFNGGAVINELSNITQEQLDEPLVTPRLITCKVLATLDEYIQLQANMKQINPDGSKGGFIRVYGNLDELRKGYVKEATFSPANGTIDFILEEKYEDIYTTITRNGGIYSINEVGYPTDILPYIDYRTDGDYIRIFDLKTRPLTRSKRYDFVKVDGVVYDNINELTAAIEAL